MADGPIDSILGRIRELQDDLDREIARRATDFRYRLEGRRVIFEADARAAHRALRIRVLAFLRRTRPLVALTSLFIYTLIIPFALLDLFVIVFQALCFPLYGIPKVPRGDYIRMDRHQLQYLNGLQKLNCAYCGYCNGVIAWVREVAGRTEAYWCPIKHASRVKGRHDHYAHFVAFGDGAGFETGLARNRRAITGQPGPEKR